MTDPRDSNAIIASLYNWGARAMGTILVIGIVLQFVGAALGPDRGMPLDLARFWPAMALIGLWIVPVLALTLSGLAWVSRNRRDWAGWMAIAVGVFLSSLWALK